MNKFFKTAFLAAVMTLSMCAAAFAGTWKQDGGGWQWQADDGSNPKSSWQWLDGNNDGIAECYYFDENGYLLTDTYTPDGYRVNPDGAWIVDGVIQKQTVTPAVGAGGSEEAKALYREVNRKAQSQTGMNAKARLDMTMSLQGTTVPLVLSMDMKMKDLNTSSMKYLVDTEVDMSSLGISSMKMTIFYVDGYYYMDFMGQKMKAKMDLDAMVSQVKNSTPEVDTSYLRDLSMSTDANGNRVLTYTADGDMLGSYVNNVYSSANMEGVGMKLGTVNGTTTVNAENYIISETMHMDYEMAVQGETVTGTMNMTMEYINPGQPVDFALPSTEGYTEGAEG